MIDFDREIDADINHFDQIYRSLQNSRINQYYDTESFNGLVSNFNQRDFSVMHLNIKSIKANGDSLLSFVSTLNYKFDIVCVTETRLHDLEQANAVFQNYTSYKSNRVNRPRGGAVVFILTSIICELMTNLTADLPHIEAVFVKVILPNKTVILSSIYRPPNTIFNDFKTQIDNILSSVSPY